MKTPARTTEPLELISDFLTRGAVLRAQVTGASMAPTIRSGDFVLLGPPPSAAPVPGMLVLLGNGARHPLLHRLVKVLPSGELLTRGDAAVRCDPPAPPGSLLGVVLRVERPGGRVLDLATRRGRVQSRLLSLAGRTRARLGWIRRRFGRV